MTRLSRGAFAAIFAGVCLLAGVALYFVFFFHAGPPPLDHGLVVAKDFTPAHIDYIPGINTPGHEQCSMIGKTESCTYVPGVNVPPQFIPVADRWRVRLSDGHRQSWRSVNHPTYDAVAIGQTLDLRS